MKSDQIKRKFKIDITQKIILINVPDTLIQLSSDIQMEQFDGQRLHGQVVLVFCSTKSELESSMKTLLQQIEENTSLWISYPKKSSKIDTDINRDNGWQVMEKHGYLAVRQIAIDESWSALRFKQKDQIKEIKRGTDYPGIDSKIKKVDIPAELKVELEKRNLTEQFENQNFYLRREQAISILTAKKSITKINRISTIVQLLQNQA